MDLTPIPGGTLRFDDDGEPVRVVMTCGTCGRSWNDALSSSVTPTPAGRCPFEHEHEEEPTRGRFNLYVQLGNAGMGDVHDLADALARLASVIREWDDDTGRGRLLDTNGNGIGTWSLEAD